MAQWIVDSTSSRPGCGYANHIYLKMQEGKLGPDFMVLTQVTLSSVAKGVWHK